MPTTDNGSPRLDSGSEFQRAPLEISPGVSPESVQIRSLPDLIDYNAEKNPSWPFAIQEVRQGGKHVGLIHITFSDLRHAIIKCAQILSNTLIEENGQPGPFTKPVSVVLESDVTLFVHLAALLYLDIPVLLLSIRLSPVAIAHLLKVTSARGVVMSPRSQRLVEEALTILSSEQEVDLVSCLSTSYESLQSLPLDPQYKIVRRSGYKDEEKFLILHSSGTTGLPKPIQLAHRYLLGYAACHQLEPSQCTGRINISTLPMFHGFGLLAPCLSLSTGKPCCFPSAAVIPSASSLADLLEATGAYSLMTVPTVLEDTISDFHFLQGLAHLDFVAVGGGAIKPAVGEHLVSHGVSLLNHYGATEIGAIAPIFLPGADYDWHYLRLRTDLGLQLNESGQYDKNGQPLYRLTGHPYGWETPLTIQDLLTRRPGAEHIEFAILGRTDDLIVLATGEKLLPQQLELAVAKIEGVKGAIVFGEHQDEVGVIVEPTGPIAGERREEFISILWATIQRENATLDRHARVASSDMVLLAPPGKSIPRSDKGSFMRKEAYRVFQAEINSAYNAIASTKEEVTSLSPDPGRLEKGLGAIVERCVQDRIGAGSAWTDTDDFFEMGMDSLEASRIARILNQVEPRDQFPVLRETKVQPRFIYQNPSIQALAVALRSDKTQGSPSTTSTADLMMDLAAKYGSSSNKNTTSGKTVLLTGATGHLGVHLLHQLCLDPTVNKIICFNRSRLQQSFLKRQEQANIKIGVALSEEAWSKIHFHSSDQQHQPFFGLPSSEYAEILREVTHVVHNAWPMDFERKLHSFHPQLQAMQNLISFATQRYPWQRAHPKRLLFISSIAVAAHHPSPILKETPVLNPNTTADMGYAQAKWICEKMLTDAAACAGPTELQAMIIRLGQVAGSTKSGVWNTQEHVPTILKASQLVGALPRLEGTFSWIPTDIAAKSIVEILSSPLMPSQAEIPVNLLVFHIENPIRQPWEPLLAILANKLKIKHRPLSLDVWLDRACEAAGDTEELAFIHSLRFFFTTYFQKLSGGGIILDTARARAHSRFLRTCNGVGVEQLDRYISVWKAQGFLI